MGGHGGLNILPQKRWNVYRQDNREKVRKDEEAAAKEEQLKREQSRKRDAEFRLQHLRQVRGLSSPTLTQTKPQPEKSNHINLFEGIKIFDPVDKEDEKRGKFKKLKKEEAAKVVDPEDEKYRLGYGLVGKGVKLPWYMAKRAGEDEGSSGDGNVGVENEIIKGSGKKSLEELREERLKRERREKGRERELLLAKGRINGTVPKDRGYSKRWCD